MAAFRALAAARELDAATVALGCSLAAAIDAAPDVGLAALAKEYRALLKDVVGDAGAPDPADDWLRSLSASVGDTPQP